MKKNYFWVNKTRMNIHTTSYSILQNDREKLNTHQSFVIWLTGLSGSGKSSIAQQIERDLHQQKTHCFPLDGDNIRTGLNSDLSFSNEDRSENIRRIAEVSKLIMQSGSIVIVSFISPFEKDRMIAKEIIGRDQFIEIFIDTPLIICKSRDPKGLYKKVNNGEIKNFTGIDSPYEKPTNPDLIVTTEGKSIQKCVDEILNFVSPFIQND